MAGSFLDVMKVALSAPAASGSQLRTPDDILYKPICPRCEAHREPRIPRLVRFDNEGENSRAVFSCGILLHRSFSYPIGFKMSLDDVKREVGEIEKKVKSGEVKGQRREHIYPEMMALFSHFVPEGEEVSFTGFCRVCFKQVEILLRHDKVLWNDCIPLPGLRSSRAEYLRSANEKALNTL